MVARLRTSFRYGNLAEHLGLLLLKGVAAVADVPRTEDVGLDAVANLLRFDSDGNSYAEESFGVQIKAASAKNSLRLRGHSLEWLLAQEHPLFLGCVSLESSSIELHPLLRINQAAFALHATELKVLCEASPHGHHWDKKAESAVATVWLGKPLMRWSLSDLKDKEWCNTSYKVMKRFLAFEKVERKLIAIGKVSRVEWETNEPGSIESRDLFSLGSFDRLKLIANDVVPNITQMLYCGVCLPADSRQRFMDRVVAVLSELQELGAEVGDLSDIVRLYMAVSKLPN